MPTRRPDRAPTPHRSTEIPDVRGDSRRGRPPQPAATRSASRPGRGGPRPAQLRTTTTRFAARSDHLPCPPHAVARRARPRGECPGAPRPGAPHPCDAGPTDLLRSGLPLPPPSRRAAPGGGHAAQAAPPPRPGVQSRRMLTRATPAGHKLPTAAQRFSTSGETTAEAARRSPPRRGAHRTAAELRPASHRGGGPQPAQLRTATTRCAARSDHLPCPPHAVARRTRPRSAGGCAAEPHRTRPGHGRCTAPPSTAKRSCVHAQVTNERNSWHAVSCALALGVIPWCSSGRCPNGTTPVCVRTPASQATPRSPALPKSITRRTDGTASHPTTLKRLLPRASPEAIP